MAESLAAAHECTLVAEKIEDVADGDLSLVTPTRVLLTIYERILEAQEIEDIERSDARGLVAIGVAGRLNGRFGHESDGANPVVNRDGERLRA